MELSAWPGSLGVIAQSATNRRDRQMGKAAGPGDGSWFGGQGMTGRQGPDASEHP
jgi:hypothetical protein